MIVTGRNVEVPAQFRALAEEKLDKAVRLDPKIISVHIVLLHEPNPRQQEHRERVEITCYSRGPVVRAEAAARDFHTALEDATTKLTARLRRAADRRRVHRGRRAPVSVAAATAGLPTDLPAEAERADAAVPDTSGTPAGTEPAGPLRVVREKEHPGDPISVDDAVFQMELLGHDFYLFRDRDSGRPSVVYRRRGYDYGVISLAAPGG